MPPKPLACGGKGWERDDDRLVVRGDAYEPVSGFEVAETVATLRALVARLRGAE